MGEMRFVLVDPSGLHARPAARFVQTASRFRSTVTIIHGLREANAKSLLSLLGLALREGSEITLRADGDDAAAALTALTTELAPFVKRIQTTARQIIGGVS
jgi:phosphotransferase system HPr (HPr) family protein